MSARTKLILTALATGLIAFLTMLTASTTWDAAALRGAAAAGVAALIQFFTPLSDYGTGGAKK